MVSPENRQPGGGCVGGLLACPRSASFTKDGGAASTRCGRATTIAGKTAPTKLTHLSAQAIELLELSWSLQHGQHGMSALSGIDISTDFVEMVAPPVAGTIATEIAIRAARTVRTISMRENYQAMSVGGQQLPSWFGPFSARQLFTRAILSQHRRV
jgi:hypothetical protein